MTGRIALFEGDAVGSATFDAQVYLLTMALRHIGETPLAANATFENNFQPIEFDGNLGIKADTNATAQNYQNLLKDYNSKP